MSPQCIRLNSSNSRSTRQHEEEDATSQSSLLETEKPEGDICVAQDDVLGAKAVGGGVTPCLNASAQASHPSPGSLAPTTLSSTQTNPSHPSLPATHSCPAPPAWPSGPGEDKCWRSGSAVEKEHFFLSPSLCCFEPPGWLTAMPHRQVGGRRDEVRRGAGTPRACSTPGQGTSPTVSQHRWPEQLLVKQSPTASSGLLIKPLCL